MKKIILVLVLATNLFSQSRIQLDAARFKGEGDEAFVEFYYSFDVSNLTFTKNETGFLSEAIVQFLCKRSSDDSLISNEKIRIPFILNDSTALKTSRIYTDLFQIYLKDDIYRVSLKLIDGKDLATIDSVNLIYNLTVLPNDRVALSDLEICNSITQSEKNQNNQFYKNTFDVRPNVAGIFGTHQPVLYYYLEAYNLNFINTQHFYSKVSIYNSFNKEVLSQEKIKKNNFLSAVDVGVLKVNSLNSGAYLLVYEVLDSLKHPIVLTSKKFFIYNSNAEVIDTLQNNYQTTLASEYSTYTIEEINREFEIIKYISSKTEIDQFKKIKLIDAKRKYFVDFWQKKNQLNADKNYKVEFFNRVDKANKNFKTGFKEGWKTDRGRVLIVYGEPDEIERHNSDVDAKPYEVWFYNSIQGGVRFYFGDRTGFSDYQLLHSTHRDELHDENWMKYIQTN